jgi:hypothetical protein
MKNLEKIRKEFAELKGAGCIPVLMSFDEYLTWSDNMNDEPEFDSAGFSIADRFGDDDEEGSHHCDDLDCNCSF